ncbi:ead/Ea22-like family protein [Enterobacter hormaechei]|nr:ead/Ea22-like family protein [Enterobacter hormaechei]
MSNIDKQALRQTAEKAQEHGVFNMDIHSETVLALLDELEKMQAQSSKWCEAFHKAVSVGARYEERIAELEAREVVLPQRYSMLHRVDFDEPYHTEMVYKQHQVLEALHDAGVKVAAAAGKGD